MGLPRRGERGATLIIALVVMLAMGVLVAAVTAYATTSSAGISAYRKQRDERYAGDAAIKAAVNWVATKPNVARDDTLGLADPACITTQTVRIANVDQTVKVSCKADSGGESGKPTDVGLTTPESLLLLSDRSSEPGPYNAPPCRGWFDSIAGFFTNDDGVTPSAADGRIPEVGAWFKPSSGLGNLGASCADLSRTPGNFKVQGDVAVKSNIRVDQGSLTILGGSNGGKAYAGESAACPAYCTALTSTRSGFTGALNYLNNTSRVSDPGRTAPAVDETSTIGNIAAPFVPVGFNADGTPKATMDVQTTAYLFDSTTLTANTATAGCPANSTTIVFKPGWYKSADVLNSYMNSSTACKDITFWFAPEPGPDGKLLTKDDVTGAFYFDFRAGAGSACHGAVSSKTRWCIGGASNQNARVVVGTPKGWTPQGSFVAAPGGGDTRTRTHVVVDQAGTIDKDLSQSWSPTVGADVKADAKAIDGVAAKYHADVCLFGACVSSDRAIRSRDFTPKVTGAPIDELGVTGDAVAAPKGRVYVEVAYGVTNPASVEPAQAVVEAVSPSSGRKSCGTYTLYGNAAAAAPYNNKANANYASGLHTYKFTPAQARQLADACGSLDLINGLEVKVQISGNNLNLPPADWYLDGVRLSYDSFPGASFPSQVGTGTTSGDVAAKSDCDPTKAGGQLIFGGESHVYVADGSLEVCAGPYPVAAGDSVNDHQSIGVWALPSVAEVGPTGTLTKGGDTDQLLDTGRIGAIDGQAIGIKYNGCGFCGDRDAWVDVGMKGYTPPAGYKIQRITARVGYNPKNNCAGFLGCPGEAPSLQTAAPCGDVDFPKHKDQALQVADFTDKAVLFDDGSTGSAAKNCLGVTAGGGALPAGSVRWHARAQHVLGVVIGSTDGLDGIMYQVTLAPLGSTNRLLPQTGCAIAHPQYNGGADQPDCALIKANTLEPTDNYSLPWAQKEGQWRGRFSVKGTIYAPSAAVEVDDTDTAYPLATRGAVLRHLRVTGFAARTNYDGTAIDNTVDRTPQAREATFTACIQVATTASQPCGTGDRTLTRARVRFEIDPSEPDVTKRAKTPNFQWYSDDR